MIAYCIDYSIRNKVGNYSMHVDAVNLASAKKKIGKKHGYKDGRMIKVKRITICGYL